MADSYRLQIPAPALWLDANRRARLHHMARSRDAKAWREAAFWAAAKAKLPKGLQRVRIVATLHFPTNRHRDRENYYDAVKPVIDGLAAPRKPGQVGYGLIPDDTPEHLAPVVLELVVGKPKGATRFGLLTLDIERDGDALVARSEARLKTRIWDDPDFLALPGHQKLAYLFLISQADISHCGVLSLRLKRWARKLSYAPEQLDKALVGLEAARFVVVDHDEEELLVRSFLRNDGVCANFKVLQSASRQMESVSSVLIREVLAGEIERALGESLATEKTRPTLLSMLGALGRASDATSDSPCSGSCDGSSDGSSDGPCDGSSRKCGGGGRGSSKGSRSVGGSSSRPSGEATKPTAKRGTRIPDDFAATDDMRDWAKRKHPRAFAELEYHTEQFIAYWRGRTGQIAVKLDWKATWESWIRKAHKDAAEKAERFGDNKSSAPKVVPADQKCEDHRRPLPCSLCKSEQAGRRNAA